MNNVEKKSIRSWVTMYYDIIENYYLVRKAARIVKKLGIGEPIGGRTGTLLNEAEWENVLIQFYLQVLIKPGIACL